MAFVYCITNKVNGKIYIGETIKTLKERLRTHYYASNAKHYKKSRMPILLAIRKYGIDNFEIEPIQYYDTEEEAKQSEIFWIAEMRRMDIPNYNICDGGDGGKPIWTPKRKRQHSKRMSGIGNPMYGKPMKDETKQKLSAVKKGRPGHKHDDAFKERMSKRLTGLGNPMAKITPEMREQIQQLYLQGEKSQREVAEQFGISRESVWQVCRDLNRENVLSKSTRIRITAAMAKRRTFSPELELEITRLRQSGVSSAELAKKYNRNRSTINVIIKRNLHLLESSNTKT